MFQNNRFINGNIRTKMATNHISLETLTDHIMNSDSSSCEESEMAQLTTDDLLTAHY